MIHKKIVVQRSLNISSFNLLFQQHNKEEVDTLNGGAMHFHRTNSPPNPSLLTTTVSGNKNSNYSHRVHHHRLRKPKSYLITSTSYSPVTWPDLFLVSIMFNATVSEGRKNNIFFYHNYNICWLKANCYFWFMEENRITIIFLKRIWTRCFFFWTASEQGVKVLSF